MLSERKHLLRVSEALAIVGAVAALSVPVLDHFELLRNFLVVLAACTGVALMMLTFLPACLLMGEYAGAARDDAVRRQRASGLNATELAELVRWAPQFYKVAAVLGPFMGVGAAVWQSSMQSADASSGSLQDVTTVGLSFAMFFLLSLPVLGSAARMPGRYAG